MADKGNVHADDKATRASQDENSVTEAIEPQFMPITSIDSNATEEDLALEDEQLPRRQQSHAIISDTDRRQLHQVATALSRRRTTSAANPTGIDQILSFEAEDSRLDPQSKSFDLSRWLRRFFQEIRAQGITPKQLGVAYENLDVSGTGEALQVQSTVGSFLAAPLQLGELFSFGKKQPKQILHSFDGIIKSGELLIVLGRPGSGCSTLLKSLTGELHGLQIGEKSGIHYNGIPQQQMVKEFKGEIEYNQEVR
jgi:ATP-binding cassette, subfamily G (WHITE), member 2, PDR